MTSVTSVGARYSMIGRVVDAQRMRKQLMGRWAGQIAFDESKPFTEEPKHNSAKLAICCTKAHISICFLDVLYSPTHLSLCVP